MANLISSTITEQLARDYMARRLEEALTYRTVREAEHPTTNNHAAGAHR